MHLIHTLPPIPLVRVPLVILSGGKKKKTNLGYLFGSFNLVTDRDRDTTPAEGAGNVPLDGLN